MILEAVTPEVGQFIAQDLDIPVFGIGAGPYCDGQLLLVYDLLGIWEAFQPKFVKRYARFGEEAVHAFEEYIKDVHEGKFPGPGHCYRMIDGEDEKLRQILNPK